MKEDVARAPLRVAANRDESVSRDAQRSVKMGTGMNGPG
jgi:hypothetical protein